MESTQSVKEMEMIPVQKREEVDRKFKEYFSFGKYMEMHQRVEYLENELDKKTIVKKRMTIVPVVKGEEGGLVMRYESNVSWNQPANTDEEFKSCRGGTGGKSEPY
jgi:hypothetical protein